jgi:hypothetical protein
MTKQPAFLPSLDGYFRSHPRLLIAANIVLTVVMTLVLLTTTDAPVVLYQAF